ncbi:MAG TPA: cyclic nucleotide-binding domain-containing protein [Bacteriovoracaceae bacterium]|nr:cyclic nucleotide-binding domain-containing protein [Bacteriovoracaceae bacterium]
MHGFQIEYRPYDVICREGDPSDNMFFLKSGKLLVCVLRGTEVKVLARVGAGQFLGELAFFDGQPRSSSIIVLERSVIVHLSKEDLSQNLPLWFIEIGKNITKKIRTLDKIIQEKHLKKTSHSEDNTPLSLDDQRKIFSLITHQHD